MRRSHAVLLLAATMAAAHTGIVRGATPADTPRAACTARPGNVTLTSTGLVKAGRTLVTCARRWTLTEGIQYRADSLARPGTYSKWIFGGTKLVSGVGDTLIAPYRRPYHECGDWRIHVVFASGQVFNGAKTWFCS